jgi:hypothetical protein
VAKAAANGSLMCNINNEISIIMAKRKMIMKISAKIIISKRNIEESEIMAKYQCLKTIMAISSVISAMASKIMIIWQYNESENINIESENGGAKKSIMTWRKCRHE